MIVTDGLVKEDIKTQGKSDYQKWIGKHIDKTASGKFKIRKSIKGKNVYFGTYDSFDEAIRVRDMLIDNGWDKSILITEEDRIKEYYKYIRRNGDYYYDVNRPKNNKKGLPRYMGTCLSIEEALYYRDIAKSKDYIIGKPQEYDLITDNPYINEGLKYPLPETLTPKKDKSKSRYGKGYVKKKGHNSYQVWCNKNYYGSYTTSEYAEYIRLKLYENNWDTNKLEEIKKGYPEYYTYILHFWKYIYYNENVDTWSCRKYFLETKEFLIFTFNNPYDALHERDLYEEHGWDIDSVVELAVLCDNPYKDIELPPYPTRRVKIKYDLNEEYYTNFIEDMAFFIREFNINSITAMRETLDTSNHIIYDALSKFNISWEDFRELVHSGEDILSVLTYENIVVPDLEPVKSKSNYIYYDKSQKYSPWLINHKGVYFGRYSDKNSAVKIVNRLEKCGWDKKQLNNIRESIGYVSPARKGETSKLIYKDKRNPKKPHYYIKRYINGESIWYGSYKDKETAEKVVRQLKKYNWDKEKLPEIKEKIGVD
jgi:hypothetical protein